MNPGVERHRSPRRRPARRQETAAAGLVLEGVHVLVVEDNADFRMCLVESLRAYGARGSSAEGGTAAYALLLREEPDVIVSDLTMSAGSGAEFIGRVRRLPPERGGLVPAIAMSSLERQKLALEAGFDAFVPKPFDCADLARVIRKYIHRVESCATRSTSRAHRN